jgi:hypothetical protein
VVVMPLIRDEEVTGVFELLSGRAYAFEERDITALQRLGEMILTALEHADAAKRAQKEIAAQIPVTEIAAETKPERTAIASSAVPAGEQTPKEGAAKPAVAPEPPEAAVPANAVPVKIKKCESCGFPVSEGRSICLDCEAARESSGQPQATAEPAFLSQLAEPSWFAAHKFLIAMLAVTAITLAVVLWLR